MLNEGTRKRTQDRIMKLAALSQALTSAPENITTDPSHGLGNAEEPFSQTRQEVCLTGLNQTIKLKTSTSLLSACQRQAHHLPSPSSSPSSRSPVSTQRGPNPHAILNRDPTTKPPAFQKQKPLIHEDGMRTKYNKV